MPTFNLAEILSFLGNLAREAFKMIVLKAILISVAIIVLPWALRKAWFLISNTVWGIVSDLIADQEIPLSLQLDLDGLLGFLCDCFRIPEVMIIIFSALLLAFTIRKVKS